MELGSISFPSGWDFSEKLGKDLSFIHDPVADNSKLLSSSIKLSDYMCKPVSYTHLTLPTSLAV